jgi:hypothetical protein
MRLSDILTLNYLDSQQLLREEVKRTLADSNVKRLFDSRRNSRLKEIVIEHSLIVKSSNYITETADAVGAVKVLQNYLENKSTHGMSPFGVQALTFPDSVGRSFQAIPLRNVMVTRIPSIVEALNSKERAHWKSQGMAIVCEEHTIYLDARYGWYHNTTGSDAAVLENRILPSIREYWDMLTKNDWQTLFEGATRPATKVKKVSGYGFEVRNKSESQRTSSANGANEISHNKHPKASKATSV